jgi:hypothetical protein
MLPPMLLAPVVASPCSSRWADFLQGQVNPIQWHLMMF